MKNWKIANPGIGSWHVALKKEAKFSGHFLVLPNHFTCFVQFHVAAKAVRSGSDVQAAVEGPSHRPARTKAPMLHWALLRVEPGCKSEARHRTASFCIHFSTWEWVQLTRQHHKAYLAALVPFSHLYIASPEPAAVGKRWMVV